VAKPDRIIRSLIRDRFVVALLDDTTFEGVLIDSDDRSIEIADASQVLLDGKLQKVDGHLVFDRLNIQYLQKPKA
jgi:hypothetical protein